MAYKSFRQYVNELEKAGEISHIKTKVDWDGEVGAITRAVYKRKGPAMIFENVKDTKIGTLFCGAMHEGKKFGMQYDIGADIHEHYEFLSTRMKADPIDPIIVKKAVCQEHVIQGDDIDLWAFPTPKWHPKDGGRYLGTLACEITADPETGTPNVAIYRMMIEGKNKLGFNCEQDSGVHLRKYQERKENMPFAMAISVPPAVIPAAAGKFPYGVSEWGIAGAIAGEGIPLVKCLTNDLYVPADSEVVIEGYVPWDKSEYLLEGPFGEFPGHFSASEASVKPTGIVTAITYRTNPILQGTSPGVGPNEQGGLIQRAYGGSGLAQVKKSGIPGVKDLACLEMGCASFVWAVSFTKEFYGGNTQQCANYIMSLGHFPKILILVNDDIDVHDPGMVLWAIASRVQPSRDVTILPANQWTTCLDPSLPDSERDKHLAAVTSRMIIDATTFKPGVTFSELVIDDEQTKARVKARWAEYGFPIPY